MIDRLAGGEAESPAALPAAGPLAIGSWAWLIRGTADELPAEGSACRVVGRIRAWGSDAYDVWVPALGRSLRVGINRLCGVGEAVSTSVHAVQAAAAAARINDALARDALVAPLEGTVEPLPHQISALARAVGSERVRWLLADEVGLGKTIEAGLIFKELKARGLVKRVLVVAPTGLIRQWAEEMRRHFHEPFRIMAPGEFGAVRDALGLDPGDNLWRVHDQVICPLDAVKPLDARRGWSRDQLARHNRERFDDLVTAGWDLVIIDEAHRLGGGSAQVARYKLGDALAGASPYLLLLSATPHQGKTDAFRRLLAFLDPDTFVEDGAVSRERVAPFVIRTEKRHAIDAEGRPLFQPRTVELRRITWAGETALQRDLYDGVTHYVREGYARAQQSRQTAVGFLMVLFQRMVTSSTRAISGALERRLAVLTASHSETAGQPSLFDASVPDEDSFWESDGDRQFDAVVGAPSGGTSQEQLEVQLLLDAARRCEAAGPDAKAQALLDTIVDLERETGEPALKVLVFTEFLPTQAMLAEFLRGRGISTIVLNGGMAPDERQAALTAFAGDTRILVSTDAGGEGLNLQFASVVVNYDLPWNPMKLEQRIGRVDRIGQKRPVRAVNFALAESVELRVQEVLEQKLKRILDDLGVDKLADVLDSEAAGVEFEALYAGAAADPTRIEERVSAFAAELQQRAAAARAGLLVLGETTPIDPAAARELAEHRLPRWAERLVVSSLLADASRRASADRVAGLPGVWRLIWRDGSETRRAAFDAVLATDPTVEHITLDDPRVRELASRWPVWVPGQPLPSVVVPGVSERVSGTWGLWKIGVDGAGHRALRVLPTFVADDERVLAPTARAVWDRILDTPPEHLRFRSVGIGGEQAEAVFSRLWTVAEDQGASIFESIVSEQRELARREERKMADAFAARRRAVERVGLQEVRNFRLRQLDAELDRWNALMREREMRLAPELQPLLLLRVRGATEVAISDERGPGDVEAK